MPNRPNSLAARAAIILLAAGFAAILCASLVYRFSHPDLTVNRFAMSAQSGPAPAINSEDMGAIGQLMQQVSKNPHDEKAILRLVESLMAMGQWDSAENFAQKAMALERSGDNHTRATYLLALIHHNKGEHEQAAELLEKMLETAENPSARYSLGILYSYYLNDPARGIVNLRKGLEAPELAPALADAMRSELEKLDAAKTPPAAAAGMEANPARGGEQQ